MRNTDLEEISTVDLEMKKKKKKFKSFKPFAPAV